MEMQNNNPLELYFCGHENCSPSHFFGPAVRPHYLIHYILNGQGIYYENGREHRLSTGDGFLILPGKITYYVADSKNPWEYCWIGFDGHETNSILEHCGLTDADLIFHVEDKNIAADLLELNQIFSEGAGNRYTYVSYLYKIFSYMLQTTKAAASSIAESYLEQATAYINQNYIYDIKIKDIAKAIGIDRTYLYRLFMESKKVSPQQYLIDYRLQAVCRNLKDSKLTVTEIAYSCGFKDTPSLNKHFKRHYCITPLQYRKEVKQLYYNIHQP